MRKLSTDLEKPNLKDPLHNSCESVAAGSGWAARRLFAVNSPAIGKKNNAADRPSPVDHRPQGVMQRVLNGLELTRRVREVPYRKPRSPEAAWRPDCWATIMRKCDESGL